MYDFMKYMLGMGTPPHEKYNAERKREMDMRKFVITCRVCNGEGNIDCPACDIGTVFDEDGKEIVCPRCKGEPYRSVRCPNCQGRGDIRIEVKDVW